MSDKKIYKRPISVLLMSAFIFPGTGQFVNGQIFKGILILLGTVIPLLWLIVHVLYFFSKNFSIILDTIPGGGGSQDIPPVISVPLVVSLLLVFLFFYFCGMVDAYIVARRRWQKDDIQDEK